MARRRRTAALPTIWNIPDDLWNGTIVPILKELDAEPKTGRPRTDQRKALDGILFRLRSGCQWNHLPEQFGDDSSIHRTFQRWVKLGVLKRIWAELVKACQELGVIEWEWQSSDCAMGKARLGGITRDRTPRIAAKTA
jgi:putative transposase